MGQSEHSDKDLLEIAKSKPTVDETEKADEITDFILALNLKPSLTEWAKLQDVHWAYRKWCIANKIKPTKRIFFHDAFRARFNTKSGNGNRFYGIENSKQFELSQEEWFKMRKQYRDEKQRKKTTKRRKVPRPKPEL